MADGIAQDRRKTKDVVYSAVYREKQNGGREVDHTILMTEDHFGYSIFDQYDIPKI